MISKELRTSSLYVGRRRIKYRPRSRLSDNICCPTTYSRFPMRKLPEDVGKRNNQLARMIPYDARKVSHVMPSKYGKEDVSDASNSLVVSFQQD